MSDDEATSVHGRRTETVSGTAGRGRGGHWSSTGDCESLGSFSDFASPGSLSGAATAAVPVTTSVTRNQQTGLPTAVLPDVVVLTHNDRPGNSREHQCGSTVKINYNPSKDDTLVLSAPGHSAW